MLLNKKPSALGPRVFIHLIGFNENYFLAAFLVAFLVAFLATFLVVFFAAFLVAFFAAFFAMCSS